MIPLFIVSNSFFWSSFIFSYSSSLIIWSILASFVAYLSLCFILLEISSFVFLISYVNISFCLLIYFIFSSKFIAGSGLSTISSDLFLRTSTYWSLNIESSSSSSLYISESFSSSSSVSSFYFSISISFSSFYIFACYSVFCNFIYSI